VGATEHFLEMAEIAHHRDNVVLDVAEVKANLSARRDRVLLVATLGEALDHVCLATEQAHEAHHTLAAFTDLPQERGVIVRAGDEDLVFDHLGFAFGVVDDRPKCVDNVVADDVNKVAYQKE